MSLYENSILYEEFDVTFHVTFDPVNILLCVIWQVK